VIYGERWLYIPSLGFCLFVAIWLKKLFFDKNLRKLGIILLISIISFYFFVTITRNTDWKDEVTLLEKNVNIYPQSMDTHLQLASNYIRKKDYEKALYHISVAHEMYPNSFEPYYCLAMYYAEKGPYNEAIKTFSNLLRDFPDNCKDNPDFYYCFGMACTKGKLYDEAISHYEKALSLGPYRAENRKIYNSIGNTYFQKDEFSKAIQSYQSSLSIDPDWIVPYHNISIVYKKIGRLERFAEYFAEAVSLDSTYKGFLKEPGAVDIHPE
jgi:tetratricopeptide (TPR) repeat protein